MKPKRQEKPKAYYESRSLLAECFGLNECAEGARDSEIPQDYDEMPASVRVAAQSQDKE